MAFNGTEGGAITLKAGAAMTADYRRNNPGVIKARFFGKDILNDILDQTGCMGIRMYYGENENGEPELVLVGADTDENDIIGIVADMSVPCPTSCGSANSLNS